VEHKIIAAFAFALVACLALTPGAQAASSSSVYVYLYDSGEAAADASCDWYAKVDQPSFILRDGETDLVLDVLMVAHNGTGAIADGTYTVAVTISDGTTTITDDVDINTAVALTGNITFTAASLATLAETGTGTVTYSLLNATDAELDSYVWEDVAIDANPVSGALFGIVPVVVSLLALTMVIGVLGGMMGKLGSLGKIGGRRKK
jgi:hypothetical protein